MQFSSLSEKGAHLKLCEHVHKLAEDLLGDAGLGASSVIEHLQEQRFECELKSKRDSSPVVPLTLRMCSTRASSVSGSSARSSDEPGMMRSIRKSMLRWRMSSSPCMICPNMALKESVERNI